MRFYTKQHQYYCGIDLHTKNMLSDNKIKEQNLFHYSAQDSTY
jgi:hypothetical protein